MMCPHLWRSWWRPVAAATVLLLPVPATADVVHLNSGRSKEGIIVEEGDKVVKLETHQGTVGIPLSSIASLEYASRRENRALRQAWAEEARQRERERAARRAARRAREEAEAAGGTGTVGADGQPITQAEASRRAAADARRVELDRKRVESFRRAQTDLDRELRAEGPLAFQGVTSNVDDTGVLVRAQMLNISGVRQRNIRVEAELVEAAGTPEERVVSRRVVLIPELGVDRVYAFEAQFPVVPQEPVVPRLTVAGTQPASE